MKDSRALEVVTKGKELVDRVRKGYNLSASLVPHSGYSVSSEIFKLLRNELNTEDNLLSVHNQESEHEDDFIRNRQGSLYDLYVEMGSEIGDSKPRGMSPLEYLVKSLPDKPNLLLVHNVHTTPEDIQKAQPDLSKTFWVLCPGSNRYINGSMPPEFLLREYPDQVCIGTDSLASNTRLSMVHELYLLQEAYPQIPLERLLQMVCLNGAMALGLEGKYGSFEMGKKPGVNLIRFADLNDLRLKEVSSIRKII
jgi:cytosine/adenosine deaminase-related metal-dependent hydrolase